MDLATALIIAALAFSCYAFWSAGYKRGRGEGYMTGYNDGWESHAECFTGQSHTHNTQR